MVTRPLPVVVGLVAAFTTATATADDGRLGRAGQLAIRGDFDLRLNVTYVKSPRGDTDSSTSFQLGPAADFFPIEHVSVGAALTYARLTADLHSFRVAPRVGYQIPLGELLSLWPTVGVFWQQRTVDPKLDLRERKLGIVFDAPVLVHVVPHFFLGLGPRVSVDVASGYVYFGDRTEDAPKKTELGFVSTIGGYF